MDTDNVESRTPAAVPRHRRLTSLMMIGAIAAIIGFALLPAGQTEAYQTREGGGCSGCHSGAQTPSMLTVSGLPSGSYVPGQPYYVQIVITDTNGDATGYNSFDLIMNAGTLSTTDPNVEINSIASEASANDAADLMKAKTFNLTWTAPLSGSVTMDIWGVMGDGLTGKADIWDRKTYTYNTIPEFPLILLPVIGIGCAVVLASRLSRKK